MTRTIQDLNTSLTEHWNTDPAFYDKLNKEFNFTLDPCPPDPSFNGLQVKWSGRVYVNPPYRYIKIWIDKALKERSNCEVIVFNIPVRSETKYFQDKVFGMADEIRFVRGKLKFLKRDVDTQKVNLSGAPFPSCVVIYLGAHELFTVTDLTMFHTYQEEDWFVLKRNLVMVM